MDREPISLILELSEAFDGLMHEEMKKNNIKASYRHLLMPLAVKDGVTQLDLVRVSQLKPPTVSTTLRSMENEGLIHREADKDDARATRVFITDKGREVDRSMREAFEKLTNKFLNGIHESEKKQITDLLSKIYKNISDSGKETESGD